jgi:shikimate dehydrogenase
MKKYLVIGNPIEHSLSPKLHNYWIKQNNIDAVYEKKQLDESDIESMIDELKSEKINGINVTIPFKRSVIPFLDQLTLIAKEAQSVNTIFKKDNKIVGDNTDIGGFEHGLKHINYDVQNKKVFILGAGGVVPSIILALK